MKSIQEGYMLRYIHRPKRRKAQIALFVILDLGIFISWAFFTGKVIFFGQSVIKIKTTIYVTMDIDDRGQISGLY